MKRLFTLLMLLCPMLPTALAQSNDFGTEYQTSFSFKPWRGGNVTLAEKIRLKQNSTLYTRSSTSLIVQQSLLRSSLRQYDMRWRVGAGYAFINRQNSHHRFFNQHRFILQTSLSKDVVYWRFGVRLRLQDNLRDPSTGSYFYNPQLYFRGRLSARYSFPDKPWQIELSEECYNPLNDPRGNYIDQIRTVFSVSRQFDRTNSLTLYCKWAQELQVSDPECFIALGLIYNFSE